MTVDEEVVANKTAQLPALQVPQTDCQEIPDGDCKSSTTLIFPPKYDLPSRVPQVLAFDDAQDYSTKLSARENQNIPPPQTAGRVALEKLDARSSGVSPVGNPCVERLLFSPSRSNPTCLQEREHSTRDGDSLSDKAQQLKAPLDLCTAPVKGKEGVDDIAKNSIGGSAVSAVVSSRIESSTTELPRSERVTSAGVRSTKDLALAPSRSKFRLMGSIPNFFQRGNSRFSMDEVYSEASERSSQWGPSSALSCQSDDGYAGDGGASSWKLFPEGHNRARAKRNWRVLRSVFIAIGELRYFKCCMRGRAAEVTGNGGYLGVTRDFWKMVD